MQKLLSCTFLQIATGFFSNSVLEMSLDAAINDGLPLLVTMVGKGVVSETAIVAMVLPDVDALGSCELFEGLFDLDGFRGGEIPHQENVAEGRKMVDEDGGGVSLSGKFSFYLSQSPPGLTAVDPRRRNLRGRWQQRWACLPLHSLATGFSSLLRKSILHTWVA